MITVGIQGETLIVVEVPERPDLYRLWGRFKRELDMTVLIQESVYFEGGVIFVPCRDRLDALIVRVEVDRLVAGDPLPLRPVDRSAVRSASPTAPAPHTPARHK